MAPLQAWHTSNVVTVCVFFDDDVEFFAHNYSVSLLWFLIVSRQLIVAWVVGWSAPNTGKEVIKALKKVGFEVGRVKGSHHILVHPDGRKTVVPVHSGETLGRGLFSQILRDCKLTKDEFRRLL